MEKYYKNPAVQTKEQAKQLLSAMDDFVSSGEGGQPRLDLELTKIWNQGNGHLSWEWSEETQQEIEQRGSQDQSKLDQIAAYKNDPELFLNEKVRPWRNSKLAEWVDVYAGKPLLWYDLVANKPDMVEEITAMRQTLLDWPATFTKYVTDQTIESRKPDKPLYITA